MMKTFAPWLACVVTLSLATPAQAIRCAGWTRLSPEAQETAVVEAIDGILTSSKAKKWTSLNLTRIRQCLMRSRDSIRIDFDDTCSQGQRKAMDALDEVLLRYARSCNPHG